MKNAAYASDGAGVLVDVTVDDAGADPRAASARNNNKAKKLTIDQKRQLVVDWFTSENPNLRIKDLPAAKPFVRRAVTSLKLTELRRLRNSPGHNVEGIDEIAQKRIESYRPGKKFATAGSGSDADADDTKKTNGQKTAAAAKKSDCIQPGRIGRVQLRTAATTLEPAQIRSVLLSFYTATGTDAVPLGRHLRNEGVFAHKAEIMSIVRSIGWRCMKRDGIDVDTATEKLDEVLSTINVEECVATLESMNIDESADTTSTVVDKAQRRAVRIAERQSQRKLERTAKVEAKRAKRIEKQQLKKKLMAAKRTAAGTDVQRKALANLQSNPNLLTKASSDDVKSLLMEWYSNPSHPSIVDFLKSKENNSDDGKTLLKTYARPMRILVRAGQLNRLRKNGVGKGKASKVVDEILVRATSTAAAVASEASQTKKDSGEATAPSLPAVAVDSHSVVGNETGTKKGATGIGAIIDNDTMKNLLTEWYNDDQMRPPRKFLKQEESHTVTSADDLAPIFVKMIQSKSLVELRKTRDDPDVAALAMSRIDELCAASTTAASHADTDATATKAGVGKVCRKKKQNALGAMDNMPTHQQEQLQAYLMEWFHDDSMPSVVDYLDTKEAVPPAFRLVMANIVRQHGLHQLRRERHIASKKAARRIMGAFGKKRRQKTMKAKKPLATVLPSAPPAEDLIEEGDYVFVAHEASELPPPSYDDSVAAKMP